MEAEISKRSSSITELEQRINLLRTAAKREVVAQNIERALAVIRDAYEELQTLRADNARIGVLPDLPETTRLQIEQELRESGSRPYDLPKSLTFRCLLLVLFIMLLPWPVDNVLVVSFLHVFLTTFFEVARLSRDTEVTDWVIRHRNRIGAYSAIGAWYMLLQSGNTMLARPLDVVVGFLMQGLRHALSTSASPVMRFLLDRSYLLDEFLLVLLAVVAGGVHWRAIAGKFMNHSIDTRANPSLQTTGSASD